MTPWVEFGEIVASLKLLVTNTKCPELGMILLKAAPCLTRIHGYPKWISTPTSLIDMRGHIYHESEYWWKFLITSPTNTNHAERKHFTHLFCKEATQAPNNSYTPTYTQRWFTALSHVIRNSAVADKRHARRPHYSMQRWGYVSLPKAQAARRSEAVGRLGVSLTGVW
jgi:hypothetical protein